MYSVNYVWMKLCCFLLSCSKFLESQNHSMSFLGCILDMHSFFFFFLQISSECDCLHVGIYLIYSWIINFDSCNKLLAVSVF